MGFQDKVDEARRIRLEYDRKLQGIRANVTLSAVGKQQLIKAAFEEADQAIAKLREEAAAERETERRELRRRAFGPNYPAAALPSERSATQMSYRDALARAEGAKSPSDALRMLAQADLLGDVPLARAVALVGFERGWAGVVDTAVGQGAVDAETLGALREHIAGDGPQGNIGRRFALGGPTRPPELDRPVPSE